MIEIIKLEESEILSVDIHNSNVNVIKEIRVELDGVTRAEEDHNFLLFLLLKECEE